MKGAMFYVAFAQPLQKWPPCALGLRPQGLINESAFLCLGRQTSRTTQVRLIGKNNKKFSVLAIRSVVNHPRRDLVRCVQRLPRLRRRFAEHQEDRDSSKTKKNSK